MCAYGDLHGMHVYVYIWGFTQNDNLSRVYMHMDGMITTCVVCVCWGSWHGNSSQNATGNCIGPLYIQNDTGTLGNYRCLSVVLMDCISWHSWLQDSTEEQCSNSLLAHASLAIKTCLVDSVTLARDTPATMGVWSIGVGVHLGVWSVGAESAGRVLGPASTCSQAFADPNNKK